MFQDQNVSEYLYLQIFARFRLWILVTMFKWRLLWGIKWQRFQMRIGHVPKKYAKMVEQVLSKGDDKS
jgi:hypothetical protein